MFGPERHTKSYGTISRILEVCLNHPEDLTHLVGRAGVSYFDAKDYSEYLCDLGLLESKELFTGTRDLGCVRRIYWTSYRGKILLAHLEALKEIVDPRRRRYR